MSMDRVDRHEAQKFRERASVRSSARMTLSGPRSKRTRRFKSGCRGQRREGSVPTQIVTLKVRLGEGEHVNPAVHLIQEGESQGKGEVEIVQHK